MGDSHDPPFYLAEMVNTDNIPKHIAIILDGNGRWAEHQNLPRTKGHIEGVKRVEEILDEAQRIGVKILTLFTFSTENWRRPEQEIQLIMKILTEVLQRKLEKLKRDKIKFQTIGRTERIPPDVLKIVEQCVHETKDNTGLIVNLAFNYGSRLEIIDAVKIIASQIKGNKIDINDINEEMLSRFLYTKDLPDPDLLIRTSGEKRISNFLLWQLSYSELYFTNVLWPDFTKEEFLKAIEDFQSRERRFGDVNAVNSPHT